MTAVIVAATRLVLRCAKHFLRLSPRSRISTRMEALGPGHTGSDAGTRGMGLPTAVPALGSCPGLGLEEAPAPL